MSISDDDRPKRLAAHEIGCDLTLLSVDELSYRVKLLQEEVERLEEEKKKKSAGRLAAENFFRS
ncbi:DUF1192 domain-containing protein [Agrobacterium sp.]|uniref:DUF1192 domain-containing protein n=1 Tax=Agrobacterium sp. TaxID=361 RepID=UPI0028AC6CCB